MNKLIFDHGAVGERIRRRRKELNLTQAELAEQVGCATKSCADILPYLFLQSVRLSQADRRIHP